VVPAAPNDASPGGYPLLVAAAAAARRDRRDPRAEAACVHMDASRREPKSINRSLFYPGRHPYCVGGETFSAGERNGILPAISLLSATLQMMS